MSSFNAASIRGVLLFISLPLLIGAIYLLAKTVPDETERDTDFRRERRREKRLTKEALFDLEDGKGSFTPGNARLLNISVWGACVATSSHLEIGQKIRGRVRSSSSEVLDITGTVTWCKPKTHTVLYGIKFNHVKQLSA